MNHRKFFWGKTPREKILILLLLIGLMATFSIDVNISYAKKKSKNWNENMNQLGATLLGLLPLAVVPNEFSKPRNRKKILKLTKDFSNFAHDTGEMTAPDADPSVKLISKLFQRESSRTHEELKRGNVEFARRRFIGLTNYCMACHTRGNFGPSFTGGKFNSALKGLGRYEKATLLAATRNFEGALKEYDSIIGDPKFSRVRRLEWEKSVRRALAITVRVLRDPDKANHIVEKTLASKQAASFIHEDAAKWKIAIQKWKKEPKREALTEEGAFAEGKMLLAKAKEGQDYSADRSTLVEYLRASSAFHDMLRRFPDGKRAQEALHLLGLCYDLLGHLEIWNLHELYYESCIRKKPGSELAGTCFRKYEESVYLGYTGSGGVFVPDDVLSHLKELRELSGTKK